MTEIFIYDGSFEGFLSAVFEAYQRKKEPADIATSDGVQLAIGAELVHIVTDTQKAQRLVTGMEKSGNFAGVVMSAFLSHMHGRELLIFKYIVLGFKVKGKIHSMTGDDTVAKVLDMSRQTLREVHKLSGFLRFSVMENQLMYAEISPKNNVLTLLMPHFTDRMSGLPFIINDLIYRQLGVYDTKSWYTRTSEGLTLPNYHPDERHYRQMWKCFYDTIAIDGRENHALRQQLMPKRYHKHLTELIELE